MQDFVPLLVSLLLGTLIGLERQVGHKPAGLRTHVLVCLGSTAFVIMQEYAMSLYGGVADPTRLVHGVVTGVGFLGAGTILRTKEGWVHGLTTAASIWTVAAVGVAAGLRAYPFAVMLTLLVLLVLRVYWWIEEKLTPRNPEERGGTPSGS
jgi:putative Mg2+ transporter-C (MgtC) family protein